MQAGSQRYIHDCDRSQHQQPVGNRSSTTIVDPRFVESRVVHYFMPQRCCAELRRCLFMFTVVVSQ
eukprot:7378793-Prymnesium_polylepis.3